MQIKWFKNVLIETKNKDYALVSSFFLMGKLLLVPTRFKQKLSTNEKRL